MGRRAREASQLKRQQAREQANRLDAAEWWSARSQAALCIIALLRIALIPPRCPWYWQIVAQLAVLVAFGCQLYIYRHRLGLAQGKPALITGGLFRWTRHPMYTMLVVWDLLSHTFWQPLNAVVVVSTVVCYGMLIVTCHYHEQEVLQKFGSEAEKYYARTPRLIFMYPFMRIRAAFGTAQ